MRAGIMYKGIIIAGIFWVAACFFSLHHNLSVSEEHDFILARSSARELARQLSLMRKWNRLHKMVYAPVTDTFKPSEYIKLADRDLTTPAGVILTKVNSSVMISQMSELARAETGSQFRCISLRPLNKANLATDWEISAVESLKNKGDEYSSYIIDGKGKKEFVYLLASFGEAECVRCHISSGFKEGEIIGATKIKLPIQDYWNRNTGLWFTHACAILAGLAGLFIFNKSLKESEGKLMQASLALEKANSRLSEQNRDMQTDLVVAEKLQKHLFLSHSPPTFLELHVVYNPLSYVSGDLVKMSQSLLNGNYEIFIGDGSGHGIAAAFTTIMAKMSLDQIVHEPSLARQLEHLNDVFDELLPEDRYLSGILVNISEDGLMRVVNAGHPPVIVLKKTGELIVGKEAGIPLGMFSTDMLKLAEERFNIQDGDRCFLITDGITERANRSGERYGLQRLLEAIGSCKDKNFNQLNSEIHESIESFAGGLMPDDDVTMISFEFKVKKPQKQA